MNSTQYHLGSERAKLAVRIGRRAANLHAVRKQLLHASARHPHIHELHLQVKTCAGALYELAKAIKSGSKSELDTTLERVEREAWDVENTLATLARNDHSFDGLASQSHLAAKRLSALRRELIAGGVT